MLSRLYGRAGCRGNYLQLFGLASRRSAQSVAATPDASTKVEEEELKPAVEIGSDTIPHPVPFYGPERDYVNFPDLVRPETIPPCRMLFIPEHWFQFFYKKLGVTGPYTFGIGIASFLISKELYLFDHDFHHTVAFFMWVYVFCKTPLGKIIPDIEAQLGKEQTDIFREARKRNEEERLDFIEHEKKEQWRQEGLKILYEAKKENIGLQLEAVYRQNAINFYNQVKRRLDYQVEVSKIDSRIKQQYMVDWTIKKVKEAITPAQEKEALKKCIADLEVLATKV